MKTTLKPFYTLRQLIGEKFGPDRFAFGVEITARWVSYETKAKVKNETVEYWCNVLENEIDKEHDAGPITLKQAKALANLFRLNGNTDLIFSK